MKEQWTWSQKDLDLNLDPLTYYCVILCKNSNLSGLQCPHQEK